MIDQLDPANKVGTNQRVTRDDDDFDDNDDDDDDHDAYLELVGCVVEECVKGVSLAAHPNVVVERGQLLRDHSVGEHLSRGRYVTIAE